MDDDEDDAAVTQTEPDQRERQQRDRRQRVEHRCQKLEQIGADPRRYRNGRERRRAHDAGCVTHQQYAQRGSRLGEQWTAEEAIDKCLER